MGMTIVNFANNNLNKILKVFNLKENFNRNSFFKINYNLVIKKIYLDVL